MGKRNRKSFLLLSLSMLLFGSMTKMTIAAEPNVAEHSAEEQERIERKKRIMAQIQAERDAQVFQKTFTSTIFELRDNNGLIYLGLRVSQADMAPFLLQLKELLAQDFADYRNNQINRDGLSFHLTLVSPNEYQTMDKSKIDLTRAISFTLLGLGKASNDTSTAYYVIARSTDGKFLRQQLLLRDKDFHVTLGFKPQDVYNRRKGIDTLIH